MNIVFVADQNYARQLIFVLMSAIWKSRSKHTYWIFHSNLSTDQKEKIVSLTDMAEVKVNFVSVTNERPYFDNGHISRASMFRLEIMSHLKADFLYLDLDIMLRKNWDSIEEYVPVDGALAACVHPIMADINSDEPTLNQAMQVSRPHYFNSGVFLANYAMWQQFDLDVKIASALFQYEKLGFRWSDQCVLNYVTAGKYTKLPNKFNFIPGDSWFEKPLIVHFAGTLKPWTRMKWMRTVLLMRFRGVRKRLRSKIETKVHPENVKHHDQLKDGFHHRGETQNLRHATEFLFMEYQFRYLHIWLKSKWLLETRRFISAV